MSGNSINDPVRFLWSISYLGSDGHPSPLRRFEEGHVTKTCRSREEAERSLKFHRIQGAAVAVPVPWISKVGAR